jgi:hypothetical protein
MDPNINGQRVNALLSALATIRGSQVGNAFLTVTTELTKED